MINGVTFNRNRKAEIEEKFFSDEEDWKKDPWLAGA
jgi:hypothetical protein